MGMEVKCILGGIGAGKTKYIEKMVETFKPQGYQMLLTSFADPIKSFFLKHLELGKNHPVYIPNHEANSIDNDRLVLDVRRFLSQYTDECVTDTVVERILTMKQDLLDIRSNIYEPKAYAIAYRKALAYFGTEIGRETDSKIWVNAMRDLLEHTEGGQDDYVDTIVLIDDCRFMDEADMLANQFQASFYFLSVPASTRAKRRGLSNKQLATMESHVSESQYKLIAEKYGAEHISLDTGE